ncbi:hypothetical protein E4U13_007223 [Claviceps humidiphila]|uniref:Uncharacterized protein n=1 Tax=Claviceps humidiphila TaxID=1294629 RepID=A0A9P7TML7_9HYPO|nr:hypothetical protein E4U13_007223 [Claviceps humidiphila]
MNVLDYALAVASCYRQELRDIAVRHTHLLERPRHDTFVSTVVASHRLNMAEHTLAIMVLDLGTGSGFIMPYDLVGSASTGQKKQKGRGHIVKSNRKQKNGKQERK